MGYTFDSDAVRKIQEVVRRVLREPAGERISHGNRPADDGSVVFSVVAEISGKAGLYTVKTFTGPATTVSGNLAEADLGTAASESNAIVWYLPALEGGRLEDGAIRSGFWLGYDDDEELPVIICDGGGTDSCYVVKVASALTGGGYYSGHIIRKPIADIDGSTDLAEADIGDPEVADCIIMNLMEIDQNTHDLTDAANTYQKYFVGHLRRTNDDGTKVIAINGFFFGCDAADDVIDGGTP